jgi:outer membrane protein OmpA-like peptidoglycan-associated protein
MSLNLNKGSDHASGSSEGGKKGLNLNKSQSSGSDADPVPGQVETSNTYNDGSGGRSKSGLYVIIGLVLIIGIVWYFMKGESDPVGAKEQSVVTAGVQSEENSGNDSLPKSASPETPPQETINLPVPETPTVLANGATNSQALAQFKPGIASSPSINDQTVGQINSHLSSNAANAITLIGYASSEGDISYNQQLSLERATQIRALLVSKGVDGSKIKVLAGGIDNPVADNSTAEGRQRNRRVEVIMN